MLRTYRKNLPHWRLEGCTYFLTWCLDLGQSPLTESERSLVRDALRFANGRNFDLLAFVVMDDHVHVVLTPAEGILLEKIVHSWRSYTTNRLQRVSGRVGRVWQHDYFDHIVRHDRELAELIDYTLANPWKRWPSLGSYEWVWAKGVWSAADQAAVL
ncbi:MAG: transposase [Myxococcales bacterium]